MGNPTSTLDWLHRAPHASGLDRIEAYFAGFAFDPHRHDTYAIGRTLLGVQSFHYRGGMTHGLPGTTMVIHPDEVHDGRAGSEEGFKYRMIYVEPALIQQILGGKPLPFVPGGVSTDPRLFRASDVLLQNLEYPVDPLQEQDALFDLAQALSAAAGAIVSRKTFDYVAAERARNLFTALWDATSHWKKWPNMPDATAGRCRGIFACCSAPAPTVT